MAPEILKKKPYDYRVDIWSLGILLYELYHREAPYKGRSLPEITASLEKNNLRFSVSIPLDMKDLIQKLLKFEPKDRLSIDDIFKHSWIERNRIKEKQLLCLSPRQKLFIRTKVRNIETPSQEFMENKENITPKYQENNKESLQVTAKKALSPLNINILEASSTFMKKNKNEVEKERNEKKKLVLRELKPLQEIQLNLNIDEVFNHKPNKEACAATPLPKYLVNGLIYKQKDSQNAYSQVKTTLRPHALSPSFAYQLNNSMENFIRPNTEQKKNKAPNLIRTLKNPRHQRVLKYNAEPATSLNQNQEQKQLNVKTIPNKDNHRVRKLSKSKTPVHNLISTPLTLKFEKDQSVKRCKAFKNLANQFATEVCSAKLGTINEKITASPSTSTTVSSRSRNENTGSRSKFQTYTIEADLISSQRSQESNIKVSRFQTDGDERNLTPIPFTQFHKGNGLSRRLVKKSNQDLDAVDSQFPKEDFKIFL